MTCRRAVSVARRINEDVHRTGESGRRHFFPPIAEALDITTRIFKCGVDRSAPRRIRRGSAAAISASGRAFECLTSLRDQAFQAAQARGACSVPRFSTDGHNLLLDPRAQDIALVLEDTHGVNRDRRRHASETLRRQVGADACQILGLE
ncbi:MAG: hypothetical protein QM736_16765 [Vicinamibacterales bacterium]